MSYIFETNIYACYKYKKHHTTIQIYQVTKNALHTYTGINENFRITLLHTGLTIIITIRVYLENWLESIFNECRNDN